MNKDEEQFVKESLEYRQKIKEDQERRRKIIARSYMAFTTGLAIFGIVAVYFWIESSLINKKLDQTNTALVSSNKKLDQSNQELDQSNEELEKSNIAIGKSRDSLAATLDSLSLSFFENTLTKGKESYARKEFSEAINLFRIAQDLVNNSDLLRNQKKLVNQLLSGSEEKKQQYLLLENKSKEASTLLDKNRLGENLPLVLSIYDMLLKLPLDEENIKILEEQRIQILQKIELANTKATNIALRAEVNREPCIAFSYFKLANHIKPSQTAVMEKVKTLSTLVKKMCPEMYNNHPY